MMTCSYESKDLTDVCSYEKAILVVTCSYEQKDLTGTYTYEHDFLHLSVFKNRKLLKFTLQFPYVESRFNHAKNHKIGMEIQEPFWMFQI
jgi:hypothetical protein